MQKLTVLNPCIAVEASDTPLAPQLTHVRDVSIGFVDNSKINADLFLSRIRPLLEEKYGARSGVTVRKLAPKDELTKPISSSSPDTTRSFSVSATAARPPR